MQISNVILPTRLIFSCIFGVIIPNSRLSKCTKKVKPHLQNVQKFKIVCSWGSAPDPVGGAYFVFIEGHDVNSNSVNSFKNNFDKFWVSQEVYYNFTRKFSKADKPAR